MNGLVPEIRSYINACNNNKNNIYNNNNNNTSHERKKKKSDTQLPLYKLNIYPLLAARKGILLGETLQMLHV